MKYKNIINIIFGVICIIVAIYGFNCIVNAIDDTDLALILMTSLCTGFGGFSFIVSSIDDWNKSK